MDEFNIHDVTLQTHYHPRGARYYSPFMGTWYKWVHSPAYTARWRRVNPSRHVLEELQLVVKPVEVTPHTHEQPSDTGTKYQKRILTDDAGMSDVYDVLRAFEVTDPAHAHGLKKLLCPGQRGDKDIVKDLEEGINSIQKYLAYIKQGIAG